jgi:competence protein ComEC
MIDRGWIYYPALRHAVPFALGIVLTDLFSPSFLLAALGVAAASVVWLVRYRENVGLAMILALVALIAGMLHAGANPDPLEPFEGMLLRRADIVGRIVSDPTVRNGRLEILVDCDSIVYRSMAFRPGGYVQIVVSDTAGLVRGDPRAGDHISALGSVSVPASPRAPWDADNRGYLRSRGIVLTASVRSAAMIYLFDRADLSMLEGVITGCRRTARAFAAGMVTGEEGDIVLSLLTGERTGLDAETRDAFLATGTIHVLAVSGLHVGLIALVLGVALSWIPNRKAHLPLFLLAIFLYVAIVGGGPSIVRAAVMGGAFMGARLAGRISRPINTLAFAALVVLLIDPMQLYDIGFQLSFGSVAGIILLAGALRSNGREHGNESAAGRALRWIGDALWLSTSAQLFTLPLLLLHFGSVPTMSLPANLIVVPLTTAALGAGLAGAAMMPLVPVVAEWFGASAYLVTTAALDVVRWSAAIPPGAIEVATIPAWATVLLLAGLVATALARSRRQLLFRGVLLVWNSRRLACRRR